MPFPSLAITPETTAVLLERISADELPTPTSAPTPASEPASKSAIDRCRKYIDKMPASLSDGQGNNAAFAAACICFRFGLSDSDAAAVMNEFNARCQPPWADRDLSRKIADAKKHTLADGSFGSLAPTDPPKGASKQRRRKPPENPTAANMIVIDPRIMEVSATITTITAALQRSPRVFLRTEQPIVISKNESIQPILSAAKLAAVLNTVTEVRIIGDREDKYRPLPPEYGNTWLEHPDAYSELRKISVFTKHPVFNRDGQLAAPGYHVESGIYYAGPVITPIASAEHLPALLSNFCWKSPADRTNFLAVLLSPFFASEFVGSKPALLLNGNQPGVGKTLLAQIVAILRDGRRVGSTTYNPNDEEFEKTLGARVREGLTTIIIDNAKTTRRDPIINSAVLERSITDRELSFRLLGQSASIKAENSHQFVITANSAEVSPDLMSRSIVVGLHFDGDPRKRRFAIANVEDYCELHRELILGELAGYVRRWFTIGQPRADVLTRFDKAGWGGIIGGILAANQEPDFYANQDDVAEAMDPNMGQFTELVEMMVLSPQGGWTAAELVERMDGLGIFRRDREGRTPRGLSTWFGVLASRYIGHRFAIDGEEFEFQKTTTHNTSRYQVRDVSDLSPYSRVDLDAKGGPGWTLGF